MAANALKLLAEDVEGLGVIAAAVQDALVKPEDIKLDSRSRTFGLEVNRFQWERAGKSMPFFRSRAVLAFAGVQSVRSRAVSRDIDGVHALIDVRFEQAAELPAGIVTLTFAGQTQIELTVECLDVTLADIGPAWPTRRKPDHEKTRP
ncbi:MAG: DUF2948 family protein [Alphaproteobacteria bacterium]|nr:MAG: DUF2948 family protein [Alphaproteobacteria bacterium]